MALLSTKMILEVNPPRCYLLGFKIGNASSRDGRCRTEDDKSFVDKRTFRGFVLGLCFLFLSLLVYVSLSFFGDVRGAMIWSFKGDGSSARL